MATIEKRVSGDGKTTYRVKVRVKGFDPESASFDRLTDAREWSQRIESDMRAGRHFGGAKLHTFNELADEYEKTAGDLLSIDDRKRHLETWRGEFGRDLLSDITPQRINRARDKLLTGETRYTERATGDTSQDSKRQRGKRTGPTVNRYLASLSHHS